MGARENLNKLYERFLRNESKPEDIRRLMELFGTADDQTLQDLVRKQLDDPSAIAPHSTENNERYDRIFNNLKQQIEPARRARTLWVKISAAASVVLLLGTGSYYFFRGPVPHPVIAENKIHNDVKPGGNKAYLILSNGQSIALAGQHSGLIGKDAGNSILKTADGQIKYVNRHNNHNNNESALNTLRTPVGGFYKVVLADGTKVWLNAASQLRYPADFRNLKQRKIELTGEAYFEVAKDPAHPFIVQTDDQQISVLGTHFNVNAYHDDGGSKTTLLEGSIRAAGKNAQAIIKPGQQVISSSTGRLNIDQVDTELAVAWKNDQFMFESQPVRSLMKTVARWYDVEVIYGADVPDVRFNGAISKFENISAVLKILESTGKIHFEVSGRKVYVTK
ncbi:FecR domain-containing protein [Mucilaginibacter sabulilitoris]|uniref:FecR domain-containing protein n=1 Tax=Mucilaginibacter sabulilitoris TaxID=1173583 RepID=A0ABZ0TK45_9SPHI|nr:FecR domain-containing protein [Mucilaginibacter sabulilitoris]WPU92797.1 FecR domain-containing protein [Mucilaginibacter sabulilitoris]